jgi:hypothetical protein
MTIFALVLTFCLPVRANDLSEATLQHFELLLSQEVSLKENPNASPRRLAVIQAEINRIRQEFHLDEWPKVDELKQVYDVACAFALLYLYKNSMGEGRYQRAKEWAYAVATTTTMEQFKDYQRAFGLLYNYARFPIEGWTGVEAKSAVIWAFQNARKISVEDVEGYIERSKQQYRQLARETRAYDFAVRQKEQDQRQAERNWEFELQKMTRELDRQMRYGRSRGCNDLL